tara:strand:+ start:18047 stop:18562 length:516 start_codon:yes stop_codon:yes gene_type:complete
MSKLKKNNYTLEEINKIEYFRDEVIKLEKQLIEMGSLGDPENPGKCKELNKINPLKHTFAGGCYIREINCPAGQILTTAIHKKEHPYFVIKGKVSVLTENGIKEITAPFYGVTKPGTKRVVFVHEDCTWVTVHRTDSTDVDEVLDEVLAKTFEDPEVSFKKIKKQLQLKNK